MSPMLQSSKTTPQEEEGAEEVASPEDPEGSTAKDSHSNNKIYAENNDSTTNSKRIATGNSMVRPFSMLI